MSAQKAAQKAAAKEKEALQLQLKIEENNMKAEALAQETKKLQSEMRAIQGEIDTMRNDGVPAWEQVGISTVPYRDPFHTGASKRTPTGAWRPRIAPRTHAPRPPPLQLNQARTPPHVVLAGGHFSS